LELAACDLKPVTFFHMRRILVIDDEETIREACARILSRDKWSVVCMESGIEGLAEIGKDPNGFDAVLLDQLMPGMSGMEAMNQIRSINPNLPVIIMTGSVTEDSAYEIVEQGASGCLPKPFTPDELRAAVKKALPAA
jgi:DNA-binding NtrC family response regulator